MRRDNTSHPNNGNYETSFNIGQIGQVNYVYMPESTDRGPSTNTNDTYGRVSESNEPVFYTGQSGYHRHSMSDLRLADELNSCPEYDSGDGINQSRLQPGRSINSKMLHDLSICSIVNTRDKALDEEIPAGNHQLPNRLTTPSQQNSGLASGGLNSCRDQIEYNTETPVRARTPSELRPENAVSLRQYSKYSSYQRPSPLRKRDSAPMITLVSRNACFQRLGAEEYLERSTSSAITNNQPIFTVFSSSHPHYPAGDLEMNTPIHGITSSVSMIIPTMAANLRPFPFPIQSHEDISKSQSRLSPNSSDNEHPAVGEASGKESIKRKSSRSKKSSIVAFVRGRRSNKGNKHETKHNRSYSMSRYHGGSANKKQGTLHSQRSKEV